MQNKELVMGKCIELARNVKGFTLTNPLVGAAVIKGGNAVYGIHEKYGSFHAEINANFFFYLSLKDYLLQLFLYLLKQHQINHAFYEQTI